MNIRIAKFGGGWNTSVCVWTHRPGAAAMVRFTIRVKRAVLGIFLLNATCALAELTNETGEDIHGCFL